MSDIRKPQAGEMSLIYTVVDITELMHSCIQEFSGSIEYKKGNLSLELEKIPPVRADKEIMYHVLFNLMSHALRNTRREGTVSIRCKAQAGMVIVEVVDEGDAVPEALRDRMFDHTLFADTGFQGGKGLGLAFCRLAAEGHGGSIRYDSGGKTGNHITLELPAGNQS